MCWPDYFRTAITCKNAVSQYGTYHPHSAKAQSAVGAPDQVLDNLHRTTDIMDKGAVKVGKGKGVGLGAKVGVLLLSRITGGATCLCRSWGSRYSGHAWLPWRAKPALVCLPVCPPTTMVGCPKFP